MPGAFHNDLLQLSRDQFVETVSEGLPLIWDNAAALWNEAQEIAHLGNRRAVGILQLFAEEEAAKSLLLFDAVRCPQARKDEFRRLVRGFGNHLAKGIYVKYYGSRPANLKEVKTIVDLERREVYREGDYGEFIAPNSILYMREKRLYVSYVREDDNRHGWHQPYHPDLLFGDIVPSAIIRMVEALHSLGLFSKEGLEIVREHWDHIDLEDPVAGDSLQTDPAKNVHWGEARDWNIEMLLKWEVKRGRNFQAEEEQNVRIVADELLFPLYLFELSPSGDVRDLPPPSWPEEY
jgi:AbiV family abortive infection protein